MSDSQEQKFKIDITPAIVEKSFDAAKSFLGKLIMPAVEEAGLLIKDHVTLFRFNQQVKMLNKAEKICERNNISPKHISIKLLSPMLDYSGLEEDEVLQDKWATLLSNMVDSEQNIENHVFPYILSQLSKNEYTVLENNFKDLVRRNLILDEKLADFRNKLSEEYSNVEQILNAFLKIVDEKTFSGASFTSRFYDKLKFARSYKTENGIKFDLDKYLELEHSIIRNKMNPQEISTEHLQSFEVTNLIRLGLIREDRDYFASGTTRKGYDIESDEVDIDLDYNYEVYLTDLGELFIKACTEKNNVNTIAV